MIKKHALIFSAFLHVLLVILFTMLKMERTEETYEYPIYLEYEFIERPKTSGEKESEKTIAAKELKKTLPPVELSPETGNEIVSPAVIADTTSCNLKSLAVMPKDKLTALDSVLSTNPSLLTLRTVMMHRISGSMPADTSKKWKYISPVGIDEYLEAMKYSDGFNNAKMQDKYNTGGIRIPLDAIFDLFK
jgi:hypothetical protein